MEDKNYVLYEHVNKINGKKYIGITNSLDNRWRNDGIAYKPYNSKPTKFWNAILKYGWDGFNHNVLKMDMTFKEACEKEVETISMYNKREELYNIADGGNGGRIYEEHPRGMLGKTHSDEYRKKLSENMKGNKNHFYGKKHDVHPKGFLGKSHSEESKNKTSKTAIERGVNKKTTTIVWANGEKEVFNSRGECAKKLGILSSTRWFLNLIKTGEPYIIKKNNVHAEKLKKFEGIRIITSK